MVEAIRKSAAYSVASTSLVLAVFYIGMAVGGEGGPVAAVFGLAAVGIVACLAGVRSGVVGMKPMAVVGILGFSALVGLYLEVHVLNLVIGGAGAGGSEGSVVTRGITHVEENPLSLAVKLGEVSCVGLLAYVYAASE